MPENAQQSNTAEKLRFKPEDHFFFIDSENLDSVETHLYGYCLVPANEETDPTNDSFTPKGDGSYIYLRRNGQNIEIWQDYIGAYGIYLYQDGDYFALSSSILMLIEKVSKKHPIHLNRTYANHLFVSWYSALSHKETIVQEIQLLDRAFCVHIDIKSKEFSFKPIDYKENTLPINTEQALAALDLWHDKWTSAFRNIAKKTSNITINLSGGFDSRMVFMLALNSGMDLNRIQIKSLHDDLYTHKEDYEIASSMAKRYGFKLNKPSEVSKTKFGASDTVNLSFYTKLTAHNQMYYRDAKYDEKYYVFPGSGGECLRSYWGNSRTDVERKVLNTTQALPLCIQREVETDVKKMLHDVFDDVAKKYDIKQKDTPGCCDLVYREGCCRYHFGKDMVEAYIGNQVKFTPLLDQEITQIDRHNGGCGDGNLLVALMFVRFREDLLEFPFEGGRSINTSTIEYAKKLNERFPRGKENIQTEQVVVFGEEPQLETYTPDDTSITYREYADRLLKSRKTRGLFLTQFDDSLYEAAIEHSKTYPYFPMQKFYPIYSTALVLEHVYANNLCSLQKEDKVINAEAPEMVQMCNMDWIEDATIASTARLDLVLLDAEEGSLLLEDSSDNYLIVRKHDWIDEQGSGMSAETHAQELKIVLQAKTSGKLKLLLRGSFICAMKVTTMFPTGLLIVPYLAMKKNY